MTFWQELNEMEACSEAIEWVGDRTEEEAWAECDRPDWMIWLLRERGEITPELAIAVVEWVFRNVPEDEPAPKAAINAARACFCQKAVSTARFDASAAANAACFAACIAESAGLLCNLTGAAVYAARAARAAGGSHPKELCDLIRRST